MINEALGQYRCFFIIHVIDLCDNSIVYSYLSDKIRELNGITLIGDQPEKKIQFDFDPCENETRCFISSRYFYEANICSDINCTTIVTENIEYM